MRPDVFIHEKAMVESENIGKGTRIWAFAHVMRGARIGENCNVGETCFVENEVVIGNKVTIKNGVCVWDKVILEDEVFVGPHAVFTNDYNPRSAFKKDPQAFLNTIVKTGATIGANATIVCGVTIGRCAFVGAGALIRSNIPDYAIVVGNPSRQIGFMCACGVKIDFNSVCACGRSYRLDNGKCLLN
jgi:UDP-2-acetamido-3-amino-2,3-dideoxy-glucuronate N-acetyltransferase